MSYQQTQKGKIKLIPNIEGETTYEKKGLEILKEIVDGDEEKFKEYLEFADCWDGALYEACHDRYKEYKYMVVNDKLYEVLEEKELDERGFCEVKENDDGTIDYIASWYNGGGSIEEVLESELK